MSNADLIEQAREAIDNMDDFARMANVVATGPLLVLNRSIDALELADKRIDELKQLVEDERENAREWKLSSSAATDKLAELEALLDERHEDYRRERDRLNAENSAALECLNEAERKLAVAVEALKNGRTYLVRMALINAGMLLASGEFTTLVNDSLDEFINDHLHEVSDSESPISEFDWTRITIRKMGEALAQIGGEDAR